MTPDNLRRLIPLVYQYVRVEDDVDRTDQGTYSPDERDNAQDFRNSLLVRLSGTESRRAREVLLELRNEPALASSRDWVDHLIDRTTERLADLPPWAAADVRSFEREHEIEPKTDQDLFRIACKRLRDIKRDVEAADISLRDEVRAGDHEGTLRSWLTRKLRERARDRYIVPQEEEIDLGDRPDIRIGHPRTAPVSIEVKWAEKWSLSELLERLENQLLGQYLRADDSRHGIYLLATIVPEHHWREPSTGRDISFAEVIEIVRARAEELEATRPNVDAVEVVAIDFREPRS